jgi:hypothetical protein
MLSAFAAQAPSVRPLPIDAMRYSSLLLLNLLACTAAPPWPAPEPWATFGETLLKNGQHLKLGTPPVLPPDSTYDQHLLCIGPCSWQDSTIRIMVYAPADSHFLARVEASTEGDTLVTALAFRFGRAISLDSVIHRYAPMLGNPRRVIRSPDSAYQLAEWIRNGFVLTVTGPSVTHGAPLTAYLTRYHGSRRTPYDVEWQLRGCAEFSYLFCPVNRSYH